MSELTDGLSGALRGVRDDIADIVPDKMTRIAGVDVPGLARYKVYEVTHLSPYKPIVHYVGWAHGEKAVILSEDPEAFIKMARGSSIESAADAAQFAEAFLTVTRPLTRLAYIVKSAEEVKFKPKLSASEEEERDAFLAKYGKVIAGPKASPAQGGFDVTLFMVIEQELRSFTLKLGKDGSIDADADVLESGLPLVAGGR